MKTKQYSVKVFELYIEDNKSFFEFINKYKPMLNSYLLVLNGNVDSKIREYLVDNNLAFTTDTSLQAKSKSEKRAIKSSDLEIIDSIIRSGIEIDSSDDLLVLNRINSGSVVKTKGNFLGLSLVDGKVICNGNFMLIKRSKNAMIIFNGNDITDKIEENSFYTVKIKDGNIYIDKYKKDIKWV